MENLSEIDALNHDIAQLYTGGMGLKQIAKQVGRSTSTVKAKLQKLGMYEGVHHETRQQSFLTKLDSWEQRGNVSVNAWVNGGALLLFPGTYGTGEMSCPVPLEAYGQRAVIAFDLRSVGQGQEHCTFGYRTQHGEQIADLWVPNYQPKGCELVSRDAIEPGDLFFLRSGGTFGASLSISPIRLATKPPPPSPPDLELTRWTCENGATAEATGKGWKVVLPHEQSTISTQFDWEENRLAFFALCYLIKPHSGTLRCTIKDTVGREDGQQELRWSDAGFTLECRKPYCVGPVSLTLSGASPHYLDEGITLLVRNLKVSGREREYSLPLPTIGG